MEVTRLTPVGLNVVLHAVKECGTDTGHVQTQGHSLVDTTAHALELRLTLCHVLRVVKVFQNAF